MISYVDDRHGLLNSHNKKKQNNAFCCNIQFINVAMMHMNKGMSVSGTGDLIL